MGDALLRKTYSEGFPFKRKNNYGQRDQFYITDYCPAIVSREMFAQANQVSLKHKDVWNLLFICKKAPS